MEVNNLEEAEGLLSEFRNLIKSRAWELLAKDIVEQMNGREETLHTPLPNLDELYNREFLKGEISGMYTMLGYPNTIIEDLESHISDLRGSETDD